jgi:threonine/homoserine efflux transporter RhtA
VLAAVAGLLLLGQVLALHEWIGILVVVLANVVAVLLARNEQVDERAGTGPALDAAVQT